MDTIEANIEIKKDRKGSFSISVAMPVWSKKSEMGDNILIQIPLLGLDTIAKSNEDAEFAIQEAIQSFCIAAESFGQGIESELQTLGWKRVDKDGNPILGFCVSETNELLERLLQTGDNYVNPELEISQDKVHA